MKPRAMILAAGMGSRLRPLTDHTAKALLRYRGKPMLDHVITKLISAGITEVIINVHHHAEQIIEYIEMKESYGIHIEFSDETDQLLDTGGGIYKARAFFEGRGSFIVYNIDIYSSIDLMKLYTSHTQENRLVTLAVRQRETSRNFLENKEHILCGWKNNRTGETIITREEENLQGTAFSGIHVLSDEIFPLINQEGPFSITNAYLELSKTQIINLYDHSSDDWADMAHPSNFSGLHGGQ